MLSTHKAKIAGGVLVIVGLLAMTIAFAGPDARYTKRHLRIVRTYNFQNDPWSAEMGSDFGRISTFVSIPFETPSDAEDVRVEVTVTTDFKTGPNDWGVVGAYLDKPDSGRSIRLSPGGFRLVSPRSNKRTTTTMMWASKNVPAEGREYIAEVKASSRHPKGEKRSRISGRRVTVVLEVWR